jgi:hypothetical protein
VRAVVLIVTLVFLAMFGLLTALDISHHGVTPLAVVSILVLGLLGTGIIGALRHRPPE